MDKIREDLLAQARDPKALTRYNVVQITKDQVASGGTTFRQGDVALADPDTYVISNVEHRAVFSLKLHAHQLLPAAHVQAYPPEPATPQASAQKRPMLLRGLTAEARAEEETKPTEQRDTEARDRAQAAKRSHYWSMASDGLVPVSPEHYPFKRDLT